MTQAKHKHSKQLFNLRDFFMVSSPLDMGTFIIIIIIIIIINNYFKINYK